MNRTVLAVGAHPDDIEFVMSGTLLRFKAEGFEIHYLNVSSGNLGSQELDEDEIRAVRMDESKASALLLGATWHPSFSHDLEIIYDTHSIRHLSSLIRDIQPSVILTHSLEDYMEDHTVTARLVVTAAFSRGMRNFHVLPPRDIYTGDIAVYHAQPHMNRDNMGRLVVPSLVVDVGDEMETRKKALSMHRSQSSWLESSQGMGSYVQTMVDNAKEVGGMAGGVEYGEGWRPHFHVGLCESGFKPMEDILRSHVHAVG